MKTIKGFWQHENGRVYVIESTSLGEVVGAAGPFDPDELDDIENYKCGRAIIDWIKKALSEKKLHRYQ